MIFTFRSWLASRLDPHPVYFEIARLGLKPGDAPVLKTGTCLSMEQRQRLQKYWGEIAPDLKIRVLDKGFDLAVLHGNRIEFAKKGTAA